MIGLSRYLIHKNVSSPVYLIHFVTNRCNARCRHCLVSTSGERELSLDEIDRVTRSFSRDLFNVSLTGGEPFLRPDLKEIIRLYMKNAKVRSFLLATNGFFSEEIIKTAEAILKEDNAVKLTVSLSLDHLNEKFDQLRGIDGLYQRVVSTYRRLVSLGQKRLSVQVNLTAQRENHRQLQSIIEHLVLREQVNNLSLSLVRGECRSPDSKDIDYENYFGANRLIERYLSEGRLSGFTAGYMSLLNAKNRISRKMIEETVKKKCFLSACFAGALNGVLYANGDVKPCELYADKIGNIRDFNYDFSRLWKSGAAARMRARIRKEKCFCTHECNWTTNILFNPRYARELAMGSIPGRQKKKNQAGEISRQPLSIVVCAHNEEVTIARKIEDIFRNDRSLRAQEVIIVDDYSDDATFEVAQGFLKQYDRLKVVKNSRQPGKWQALQCGIEEARGEIICMTDADVDFEPNTLENALRLFNDPRVGAVSSSQKIILCRDGRQDKPKVCLYEKFRNFFRRLESKIDSTTAFHGQCMFLRKKYLEFNRDNLMADDLDIAIRIRRLGLKTIFAPDSYSVEKLSRGFSRGLSRKIFQRRALAVAQTMLSNRDILFNQKYGKFGLFCFPLEFFINVILPFLAIAALALAGLALFLRPLLFAVFLLFCFSIKDLISLVWFQAGAVLTIIFNPKAVYGRWITPRRQNSNI